MPYISIQKVKSFLLGRNRILVVSLLFLLVYSITVSVFATPTASPYVPGETLDPSCVPGSLKCYVDPLPDQTSNSGKFLTTNGATSTWAFIATNGSMFGNGSASSPLGVLGISASDDNVLAVTVATVTVLPGSPVYANGAGGVGATLTRGTNGAITTIDGVTLAVNDRILVKNQAATLQNGIYSVTSLGSGSTKYVLTRTTDSDSTAELQDQIASPAMGTAGAGTLFAQNTDNPTVGTDPIVYAQVTGRYVTQKNSGTQTSGQIPFWTTKGRQLSKGTTNLFWDNSTSRLGVLDGTPDFTLDVGDISGTESGFTYNDGGGGLNNMTESPTAFSHATAVFYDVQIDATGTPDTFSWSDDQGNFASGVSITGSAQTLSYGVTITFGTTTGHVVSDDWEWTVNPAGGDAVINVAGSYYTNGVFFAQQDTNNLNLQIGNTGSGPSTFSGIDNTIVGMQAGAGTGSTNSIFGLGAGNATMSGSSNNLFGYLAGNGLTSGSNNIFIGNSAGVSASIADQNVIIGTSAGTSITNATSTVMIGYGAGTSNTASNVVFVGRGAGASNTTGRNNVFIGGQNPSVTCGDHAAGGSNTTATGQTFVGNCAGGHTTTGASNTFIGSNAGLDNIIGVENTFIGNGSGISSTTDSNTYVGFASGQFTTGGGANTFLGWKAGRSNTGSRNTYIGTGVIAGGSGTASGADNTALGWASAESIITGQQNVFLGIGAASGLTTGNQNVVLGGFTTSLGTRGSNLSTGSNNVLVGYLAGANLTTGSTNIIIGSSNSAVLATGSNQLDIGDTIYGDTSLGTVGIGDSTPDFRLDVETDATSTYAASFFNDGNNDNRLGIVIQAGADTPSAGKFIQFNDGDGGDVGSICVTGGVAVICAPSDLRLKENITDPTHGLDDLLAVTVHDFSYRADPTHRIVQGFIAQELYSIYPDAVFRPSDPNDYWKVSYSQLTPIIVQAIKDLDLRIEPLTSLDLNTAGSLANLIKKYLEDALNGLTKIFVGEVHTDKLCVGTTCVTEAQLQELLNNQDGGNNTGNNNGGGGDGGSDNGNGESGGDNGNGGSSDTTDPIITLLGDNPMTVNQGDSFTDPGATATDETDGDLTSAIQTKGSVDTGLAGTYTIEYKVTDAAGNHGHAERTVSIVATPQTPGGGTGGESTQ